MHSEIKADGAVFTFGGRVRIALEEDAGRAHPVRVCGVPRPGRSLRRARQVAGAGLLGVGEWGCLWGEAEGQEARWTRRWGGGWDLTELRGPEARVQEPHPTLGPGAVSRAD